MTIFDESLPKSGGMPPKGGCLFSFLTIVAMICITGIIL